MVGIKRVENSSAEIQVLVFVQYKTNTLYHILDTVSARAINNCGERLKNKYFGVDLQNKLIVFFNYLQKMSHVLLVTYRSLSNEFSKL